MRQEVANARKEEEERFLNGYTPLDTGGNGRGIYFFNVTRQISYRLAKQARYWYCINFKKVISVDP